MACNLIIFSTNPYVSQAKTAVPTPNVCRICKTRHMGNGCEGNREYLEVT